MVGKICLDTDRTFEILGERLFRRLGIEVELSIATCGRNNLNVIVDIKDRCTLTYRFVYFFKFGIDAMYTIILEDIVRHYLHGEIENLER